MYSLDRTAFAMHTAQEATEAQVRYWKTKTVEERLQAAMYLNSIAFGFDVNNPPKMDKNVFSIRKREKE